uniref:Patched family protein n=1 Tax=Romanomermis culicivorax TaxID=13658 RepID=A0A915KAA6_ROMCU
MNGSRYWKTGMPMQILVNNPHNISIYETRQQIFAMVRSFEDTDHTMNSNSTMLFLREYTMWLEERGFKDSPNATQYSGYNIKYWLRATGSRTFWESQIQWGNESLGQDPYEIIAFRFAVGLKNFALPPDHQDAVVLIRSIGDNYSHFNITCFQQQSPFVDQYLTINSTTIRNTVLSLAIMIFIALLLIPHPICGIFMAFSVISIDVGVSGYLYYWGVNMDCISMITMIMATGFAVDLSAHVSYAYVRAEGTSNQRAMKSLETLGWPVFQARNFFYGVTSTLLGVLVMGTIDAYIISTFFKTVVIVIVFGLMHSIIFLPVALTMFVRDNVDCCRKFRSKKRVGVIFSSPSNDSNCAQSVTHYPKNPEKNTKKNEELNGVKKEDHNTSKL